MQITSSQLKMIWGLARKLGMDSENVHALAKSVTGSDSLKQLDSQPAARLIDRMMAMAGQAKPEPLNRDSKKQLSMIFGLAKKLGWSEDPARLRAFLEKRYGVSHPRFLNDTDTNNVIEALKAMLKGGRGERRKADGGQATQNG